MWMREHGRPAQARGTATVEFAIVAPVLLIIMLAVAEFGWAFRQHNVLTKSVRDAARFAAGQGLFKGTNLVIITDDLMNRTRNLVRYGNELGSGSTLLPGIAAGDVTVTAVDDIYVRVSATWHYAPLIGSALPAFGLGTPVATDFTFVASSVVRGL